MNGLSNAILTMLLSWLRSIVNRVWSIINSETGSHFFSFLTENWLTILLVLGAGGFLLDKVIYLIRWRPFSVRRRRREQLAQMEEEVSPWPEQPAYNPYAKPQPAAGSAAYAYAEPAGEPASSYEVETPIQQYWDDTGYDAIANESVPAQTAVFSMPAPDHSAYRPPLEDIDPVFDEQALWAGGDALVNEPAYAPGAYAPVSDQYQQDVNAGFARPIPPEQLYAQPQQAYAPAQPPAAETQPVHPGLDAEVFRRTIGAGSSEESAPYAEEPLSIQFTPFTQQAEAEQSPKKKRNPFLNLMQLVGDEAAKPSIRDLQSSVDVRDAFREPVYPQPLYRNEDDPS